MFIPDLLTVEEDKEKEEVDDWVVLKWFNWSGKERSMSLKGDGMEKGFVVLCVTFFIISACFMTHFLPAFFPM